MSRDEQKKKAAVECKLMEFGSAEQTASINLRDDVLRKPLGMSIFNEALAQENDQLHFAAFDQSDAHKGTIAACLILVPNTEHTDQIKLRQMAVAASYQGQGVGRALLTFAEEYARERGFALIYANARETALEFYRALGWRVAAPERFLEVGIPHFKMEKSLIQKQDE